MGYIEVLHDHDNIEDNLAITTAPHFLQNRPVKSTIPIFIVSHDKKQGLEVKKLKFRNNPGNLFMEVIKGYLVSFHTFSTYIPFINKIIC